MKRKEKITRLHSVGFPAEQLTRMSNETLDATYAASQPLMEKRRVELEQAMRREGSLGRRLRARIARESEERQKQDQWLRNWQPPRPILIDPMKKAEELRAKAKALSTLFRASGSREYADMANAAVAAAEAIEQSI